ncbi:SOS response-associated peptidase family protein [Sphingomonas endolithica]|uniref:SOS response-associated peptidase family protein n=1 Tax=Sphingomonas endolithica TaxID=2972485 RepID=UPI0021AF09E6|nr:SOS response-associated peptidase family protein [Sphingomonas sp. ZFBP2030]
MLNTFAAMTASPFDPDAPIGSRRAIIRRNNDDLEMVELAWGLKPFAPNGRPYRFERSEGRSFPSNRCLIPASEFHVAQNGRRYRFVLAEGDWFYLAGIWQPGGKHWPESYAILTVAANPEVARYQERQGAVLLRHQRMDWLDATVPEAEVLQPAPTRSFRVEQIAGAEAAQQSLPL